LLRDQDDVDFLPDSCLVSIKDGNRVDIITEQVAVVVDNKISTLITTTITGTGTQGPKTLNVHYQ
jgi:hypothetical protein